MKTQMSFDMLKSICVDIVHQVSPWKPTAIVAIARGGLVPATIIAKKLNLPVGVFFPKDGHFHLVDKHAKRVLFIEDLIAKGRTYNLVESFMSKYNDGYAVKTEWEFCPILVDVNAPITPKYYGIKTSDWMVMPWEDFDDVVEGDHGLFRDGSDKYGEKNV